MASDTDTPNGPGKNEELERIIRAIDKRHCEKYRWYVERHLRRIYLPEKTLSRQLYYRRVTQKHDSQLPPVGSNFKNTYSIRALRPDGFTRIDYEAARAHHVVRETSQTLSWSVAKKRVNSAALGIIIEKALKEYCWPEIIDDANVDATLKADSIRDLDAFDERLDPATTTPPFPAFPSEPQPQHGIGYRAHNKDNDAGIRLFDDDFEDVDNQDLSLSSPAISRPHFGSGPTLSFKEDHHHSAPPTRRSESVSYSKVKQDEHDDGDRHSLKRKFEDENEDENRKKLHRQLRDEKMAKLEDLQNQFEEGMNVLFAEYRRRRQQLEVDFQSLG